MLKNKAVLIIVFVALAIGIAVGSKIYFDRQPPGLICRWDPSLASTEAQTCAAQCKLAIYKDSIANSTQLGSQQNEKTWMFCCPKGGTPQVLDKIKEIVVCTKAR